MNDIEQIGKEILDTAFAIHTRFGSGLLEKAYRVILATELRRKGRKVEEEKSCGFEYNGVAYDKNYVKHTDVVAGMKMDYNMQAEPNRQRGTNPEAAPYSFSKEYKQAAKGKKKK